MKLKNKRAIAQDRARLKETFSAHYLLLLSLEVETWGWKSIHYQLTME